MKNKRKSSVSIIGGADGPTSIFIAGKSDKRPLKVRIKNAIYKCKRKRVEKRIVAGSHTLNEVVEYAKNRYGLVEMNTDKRQYREQRDCLKMQAWSYSINRSYWEKWQTLASRICLMKSRYESTFVKWKNEVKRLHRFQTMRFPWIITYMREGQAMPALKSK